MLTTKVNHIGFTILILSCFVSFVFFYQNKKFPIKKMKQDALDTTAFVSTEKCSTKWSVVTTIFNPTDSIHNIVKLGFCVIVIGDYKTNNSIWEIYSKENYPYIHFFRENSLAMEFQINKHIPSNHFSKKNLGFIIAIRFGALYIYDFDDDNIFKPSVKDFVNNFTAKKKYTLTNLEYPLINIYNFFEPMDKSLQSVFVWPRGFPLEYIHSIGKTSVDVVNIDGSQSAMMNKVCVWQSVADYDPDVDAIYRMTKTLPIFFSNSDSTLILPRGVYSPWNAQSVLIHKRAFGILLIPISVTGRVSDIWRSFIACRLLEAGGLLVSFTSPLVNQFRNPHNYLNDLNDEMDLYQKSTMLLNILISLPHPVYGSSLDTFYIKIIYELVNARILNEIDYKLAQAWLYDLKSANYVWPKAIEFPAKPTRISTLDKIIHDGRNDLIEVANSSFSQQTFENIIENSREKIESKVQKDTAVCITGQLRTANMKASDPFFPSSLEPMRTSLTSSMLDGMTVAESVVKHLYPSLGEVDVYMSISTRGSDNEPQVNDLNSCEIFRYVNGDLFCEVIKEEPVPIPVSDEVWNTYSYQDKYLQQGLLQQLYSLHRCANMIRKNHKTTYKHIVRLRPDMAVFHRVLTPIGDIITSNNILVVNPKICCCGNEDWFGMGTFDTMMLYLDRILVMQNKTVTSACFPQSWSAEMFLVCYMKQFQNIEINFETLQMDGCLVKPTYRNYPSTP